MTETQPPRRMGRSIGAVLAGILVGVTLSLGTDVVLAMPTALAGGKLCVMQLRAHVDG